MDWTWNTYRKFFRNPANETQIPPFSQIHILIFVFNRIGSKFHRKYEVTIKAAEQQTRFDWCSLKRSKRPEYLDSHCLHFIGLVREFGV